MAKTPVELLAELLRQQLSKNPALAEKQKRLLQKLSEQRAEPDAVPLSAHLVAEIRELAEVSQRNPAPEDRAAPVDVLRDMLISVPGGLAVLPGACEDFTDELQRVGIVLGIYAPVTGGADADFTRDGVRYVLASQKTLMAIEVDLDAGVVRVGKG